jgi:hypothetical protein
MTRPPSAPGASSRDLTQDALLRSHDGAKRLGHPYTPYDACSDVSWSEWAAPRNGGGRMDMMIFKER